MLQTFNIPAGGRLVNAKASFFRYESANAGGADESLRVRADGQDLGTYLPGDAITLPVDAKTWELTPATGTATAIVRLGIGGVASSRVFGSVRVIDEISDALLHVNGNASTAVQAMTYTPIVNPSANVAGLIVRGVGLILQPAATGDVQMIWVASKSAPTGQALPASRFNIKKIYQAANGAVVNSNDFNMNKLLPPGWGLFVGIEVTGAPALVANYSCAYELR